MNLQVGENSFQVDITEKQKEDLNLVTSREDWYQWITKNDSSFAELIYKTVETNEKCRAKLDAWILWNEELVIS